ncbi:PAS domain-containing sensor histidine kinase [Pseudovibrio sp. Alg231-02]|uniref:PAS domain-containing sensor histidine kinase n=1 Tax=Pseudovibrio sp. Alg231-02 TaxID=1922223 RepID=UPI001AD8DCD2|nr:PAS domain-containing sensor histidine kinase [Pseudovibrio sp. Alg231-02]
MPASWHKHARVNVLWRRRFRLVLNLMGVAVFALLGAAGFSQAMDILPALSGSSVDAFKVVWVAATAGIALYAVAASVVLVRIRRNDSLSILQLRQDRADAMARIDRLESLLETEDSLLLVWDGEAKHPGVAGHLPENLELAGGLSQLVEFETWLDVKSAEALRAFLEHLRGHGEVFRLTLTTTDGVYLEASGHTAGGLAVLRLRDLTGDRQLSARLAEQNKELREQISSLHSLLDALPGPAWQRDNHGQLVWVNSAYVDAVEAESTRTVVDEQIELLEAKGRNKLNMMRQTDGVYHSPMPVVAAGERRVFELTDVNSEHGNAGLAQDISELERVQGQLRRTLESHTRTLDQLQTPVAVFGADHRLQFYNAAYRSLWDIDQSFLETKPEEGELLDALRAARKLPEQADYRGWRTKHLECYHALDAQAYWWHLPDGRTLRVIASPHPQGGVTYFYENVTEQLDLESRFNALTRVQRETLDHLTEAVAVFGSNGRMRLSNPAFAEVWGLSQEFLEGDPHVNDLLDTCKELMGESDRWQELARGVTGLSDNRTSVSGRMERVDGSVIDYVTVPLPDGGTLLTFVNVTDTVNVERALHATNDALQEADQLKNAFIQHVSYELRSPLTTIIGFAQLLGDAKFGDLSPKQEEYTDYILSSSSALLHIINDILDLATVDAGIMELEISEVDVAQTVSEAVEGLKDRLVESDITLRTHMPEGIGHLKADERRLRQVLFNLLSNAISYSDKGGLVDISCQRDENEIRFRIKDHGAGIPQEMLDQVFSRFVGRGAGGNRQGVGLGLSIVKSFVELHGGTVDISSAEGQGTTVDCTFPLEPHVHSLEAAE